MLKVYFKTSKQLHSIKTYFLDDALVSVFFLFPKVAEVLRDETNESSNSDASECLVPTIFLRPVNILVIEPLRLFFLDFLLLIDNISAIISSGTLPIFSEFSINICKIKNDAIKFIREKKYMYTELKKTT